MNEKILNLGIIGAGNIASVVAKALNGFPQIHKYAIASRNDEKANQFRTNYGFEKAYGSYDELLADYNVDLVYIATPHSFHYEQMVACIEHQKPVLCEKAFCLNFQQAEEVLHKAREQRVFVCEAMCPAFLPSRKIISDLLRSGIIGKVTSSYSVFGNYLLNVERVREKSLGGGALLDIGIYPLYFTLSTFGYDCIIENITMKMSGEVDESEKVSFRYANGFTSVIEASVKENLGNYAEIYGNNGKIHIENIGRPEYIDVYDTDGRLIKHIGNLRLTTGYEYEFLACKQSLDNQEMETAGMSHENTLQLMRFMDDIRGI